MSTTEQDAQDREDMGRLVAGHDAALNDLMERHAEPVFRFLVRMLGDVEDAQDLAQETFVRVYRARASYQADKRFGTWLYTIAANLARNHLRWRARHPTVSLHSSGQEGGTEWVEGVPAGGRAPDGELQQSEQTAAVRAEVQRLPQDLREALVLCEWEELSMAEAAEVLKTTPKAVDSRLYRARKRLRQGLARWIEG